MYQIKTDRPRDLEVALQALLGAPVRLVQAPAGVSQGGGSGTLLAKGDDPTDVDAAPAKAGTSKLAARADHKHRAVTAAPVSVRGATNAEGDDIELARADHEHRLEVQVGTEVDGVLSERPAILFSGPDVQIEDDAAEDECIVRIGQQTDGLAAIESSTDAPISGVTSVFLTTPFVVPPGVWDVEAYADATALLVYPGDVGATEQVVSYRLTMNGTPVCSREVSVGSTTAIRQRRSLKATGRLTLAEGAYTATFEASTTIVGASTATMRWRYLGVRLLRRGA